MQSIVCQAQETFSPDLSQQVQNLQKPREGEAPRESDFFSMLSENLHKEEAAPKTQSFKTQDGSSKDEAAAEPALKEISCADGKVEKSEGRDDGMARKKVKDNSDIKEAKGGGKKKSGLEKMDAIVASALKPTEAKKDLRLAKKQVDDKAVQKTKNPRDGKNSGAVKIDPRQIEFLKKLAKSEPEEAQGSQNNPRNKTSVLSGSQGKGEVEADLEIPLVGQNGLLAFVGQSESAQEGAFGFEDSLEDGKSVSEKKGLKKNVIQVTDLRTKAEVEKNAQAPQKEERKNFSVSVQKLDKNSVEMTLDLNGQQSQSDMLSLDGQSAASDGSTFQAMLKNQITQSAGDFVRAGNIVLRDNNQGQINLILHPEGLGNVKITMELSDKSLVGHITVQSKEALEAFGQSADALKNAFIQNGFEDASFDVSFSQGSMQFAQDGGSKDFGERARQGQKIYGEFTQERLTSAGGISDNFIDDDVFINIVA